MLFKRQLSRVQWFSLLLVTVGCMVQKMELSHASSDEQPKLKYIINTRPQDSKAARLGTGFILIAVQGRNSKHLKTYQKSR